ncbi:MAG: hypothetical protein LBF33_00905 [Oscillospiraceae bacterium]|jgi:predicted metal-dependent phosphoesterase TrpH|nr:hypothetical protein [Oscillospiraceae bacterium]
MKADLCCISKYSTGSLDIGEIIELAVENEINTIAVTDVVTFDGSKKAQLLGKIHNIDVIPGCIIYSTHDVKDKKVSIQILCFMPKYAHRLEHIFEKERKIFKNRALMLTQKILCICPIPSNMIFKKARDSVAPFEAHIIQALVESGYKKSSVSSLVYKFSKENRGTAFPSTKEVINEIHEAGGFAVLSFGANPVHNAEKILNNIDEIVKLGLDGLQVWHPLVKFPEKLEKIADKYNLIKIGGSEFRGCYAKQARTIGCRFTPENEVKKIKYG